MLTPEQIQEVLTSTEADRIERTRSFTNTDKFREAICSFSNDMPGHGMPGYLLIGVGFGLNAFAHTIPALAGAMLIFTLGEMCAMPVASAYIADLSPIHLRGRYTGMIGLTWAFALVCGPNLGLALFSISPTATWLTCGALGLLAAVIISLKPAVEKVPLQTGAADTVRSV